MTSSGSIALASFSTSLTLFYFRYFNFQFSIFFRFDLINPASSFFTYTSLWSLFIIAECLSARFLCMGLGKLLYSISLCLTLKKVPSEKLEKEIMKKLLKFEANYCASLPFPQCITQKLSI